MESAPALVILPKHQNIQRQMQKENQAGVKLLQ